MFHEEIKKIKSLGLYKDERVIVSPQSSKIKVKQGDVLNFCANNYLGLSNHPKVINAAINGIKNLQKNVATEKSAVAG